MLRRTKKSTVEMTVNGRLTGIGIDRLTMALIPPGVVRKHYAADAVNMLWQHVKPDQPAPADPVMALATEYDSGYASVVTTAIVWRAAIETKS